MNDPNLRLTGVELYFHDLEAAKHFYLETLGLRVGEEQPDHHVRLDVGPAFICLERKGVEEYPSADKAVSDLTGGVSQDGVEFDALTTSDGTGSLKISAAKPMRVRLYEVVGISAEDARLVYRAKLRTDGVQGQVYLEMWCRFPGKGE